MISVVINTYNAAKSLRRTLDSVKSFDEVLVCDMESTDETLDIAREYGCTIVTFPKGDFNICEPARDFAIHSAKYEWVLVIDADEEVPAKLRDYLYEECLKDRYDALQIPRKNFMFFRFTPSSYPDYQTRFLRRDKVSWPPTIHSHPIVDGKIGRIDRNRKDLALVHLQDSMHKQLDKLNVYSDNEAVRRQDENVSIFDLVFKPLVQFFKVYFLKGGFLLGRVGYIQAQKEAFYKLSVLAKMYENELAEKMDPKSDNGSC